MSPYRIEQVALGIVAHDHPGGVAGLTLRRLRGNADAVLDDGLAGVVGVGQHRSVHVDDHLISFARGAGVEP